MKKLFVVFALCLTLALGVLVYSCSECKDVDCGNYGVCDEVEGKCACQTGYQANTAGKCDSMWRTKFVGSFAAVDHCTIPVGDTLNYSIIITENPSLVIKIIIDNYGGYTGLSVNATVADNTMSIVAYDYTVNNHLYHVYPASATLAGTSFSLAYKVDVDGVPSSDCVGVYTKQ